MQYIDNQVYFPLKRCHIPPRSVCSLKNLPFSLLENSSMCSPLVPGSGVQYIFWGLKSSNIQRTFNIFWVFRKVLGLTPTPPPRHLLMAIPSPGARRYKLN